MTVGQEQRIVAEALVAARRPGHDAVDAAFELLDMAVRPGETQRGDEMRAPLLGRLGAALDQQRLDAFMAARKSLSGPAQRAEWMPGSPPSASTTRPESSAKAGLPVAFAAASRLDARVGREGRAGLLRLGETELAGRLRLDAVRREQLAHLAQLAGIVGGDDDGAGRVV